VTLIVNQLGLNSKNSSKPSSIDSNQQKKPRGQSGRKPGEQAGRPGTTLLPFPDPDRLIETFCLAVTIRKLAMKTGRSLT
jgi:hypothetical protein